ncbi:MAG: phosphate signaling complex protein PhoU [Deltaproteobacteria bacterium]
MSPLHTDREYEADLHQLRQRLLLMGAQVEEMIRDAVRAMLERDERLAASVVERDRVVNRGEVEVDELCLRILALRQPTASDLRFVTFALKGVTDVERIGDLAVNIADRATELSREPPMPLPPELARMAESVQEMLRQALDAFVRGDAEAAKGVLRQDEAVDELYRQLFQRSLEVMRSSPDAVLSATRQLFVAKHLERLADHVTNVAEMVIFMTSGTDIRHPGSRSP